jgi:F-type H+-transporting ATPase subunit epsilon
MTAATEMQVLLRLPTGCLYDGPAARLTASGAQGSFGLLPNHIDMVTALVPSVLLIGLPDGRERFFGIDEGLLVKKGPRVEVAVRRGAKSRDLAALRETVQQHFGALDDEERVARTALSRLEADMVRRFAHLRDPHP